MSVETPARVAIPELTLGWRLQMALGQAGMTVQDMADELGMSRTSLSRWLNDRGTPPRAAFVRLWAQRCAVPYEWLMNGKTPAHSVDGGHVLPHLDSNQEPSDLRSRTDEWGENGRMTSADFIPFRKKLGHTGEIRTSGRSAVTQ